MTIKNVLRKILPGSKKKQTLALAHHRRTGSRAAVIFVHGFRGDAVETWMSFLIQLLGDDRLKDWDVYSAGYSTSLSVDLPIWTSDPEIRICAAGLVTKLRHPPLDRYDAIVLVAHSMGGLVVQRALLDSDELRQRLAHVVLYGTPSAGLLKATFGARLKPQARDMQVGSAFITQLRNEWEGKIGDHPPFSFTAVAGEMDAFVPPSSSIDPFPAAQQAVVPGNHLDIIQPDSTDHLSYSLLYKILTGSHGARSTVESARLAVEHKKYGRVIELLEPGADGLDANAIVCLALALESVGRQEDAMEVIERWNKTHGGGRSLDAVGVLAGRLKRRWMVSRQQQDFDRALELYSDGLQRAETNEEHEQAYYHAINVAYLLIVSTPCGPPSSEARDMARKALGHVDASHENHWTHATRGEACLMLGDLGAGLDSYRVAQEQATLRECDSMHMQAVAVAGRVFGEEGARRIDETFGLCQGSNSK